MTNNDQFSSALAKVGGHAVEVKDAAAVAAYVRQHLSGPLLLPAMPSLERTALRKALEEAGVEVVTRDFRQQGAAAAGGLTGANFAIATTGTVVLESTDEAVRISSTLPEKHFVLLDPGKIVADGQTAVPLLRRFHETLPKAYLAYITGPSRTADIERVLTIGVHGPRELHVLLMPGLSDDPLER